MNHEVIGNHTIGQLLGLYNRSAERCKAISEMLEEISDQMDSVRLAKADLRLSQNDGDDIADILDYQTKVEREERILAELCNKYNDKLAVEASILSENMAFGLTKLDK
jgi:hypothetical protein